jgi:hypothetical protein
MYSLNTSYINAANTLVQSSLYLEKKYKNAQNILTYIQDMQLQAQAAAYDLEIS